MLISPQYQLTVGKRTLLAAWCVGYERLLRITTYKSTELAINAFPQIISIEQQVLGLTKK
jgi:hypothetical protein